MFVPSGNFLAPFQQFNLTFIKAQKLKLFRNYLFKSAVTNYINKIRTDSVIFRFLPMYVKLAIFVINFPEKSQFQFFVVLNTNFCGV